ncbi:hypothetical protein ST47_g2671 [Ascochyta rabiei]|uniref:BTB domain-containing protein n=1 Tax=Didymella rabiei TaxID=5454 RepID=A0A163J5E6_DIDRA|nr:hypothetical protein ST47_g2671 [Ascochyta rabiei]
MPASIIEGHESVSWPLESFTVGRDINSSNPTRIFVDHATHEFGIVYYYANSVAAVEQFSDTGEPVYFQAKTALMACWHSRCKKISVLFQHLQVDLKFCSTQEARDFLDAFKDAATITQNNVFYAYEHNSIKTFSSASFDMMKDERASRIAQHRMDAPAPSSEWPSLRKSGEWSDFTIMAGGKSFPVHRVRLCKDSSYFTAVCNRGFAESNDRSIQLPESERTIDTLLDEMYDTYNSTTGSLFTGFALRSEMEKERVLNDLLDLFVASDKYNFERIKTKVARAIIDRMPFVHDSLTIVDSSNYIFDDGCPQVDCGLRKAVVAQIQCRLPAIINDKAAWQEYSNNKALLNAFHIQLAHLDATAWSEDSPTLLSPPPTPTGGKRKRTL